MCCNSMKQITIIIPVYNVEPYIRKCLDSIVNQSFRELEIICINDGSTDRSGEICEEYAASDVRFRVIHQPNSGISAAINAGLDLMSGEYVGFVDPDDWLELNFYDALYRLIEEHQVDFVCTGYYKNTPDRQLTVRNEDKVEPIAIGQESMLIYTFIRDRYPAFGAYYWNKLFRSSVFNSVDQDGKQLRLCKDLVVGSDVLMFAQYIFRSRNAIYVDTPYYHYFQRETSIMHSRDIGKRMHSLFAYSKVLDLLDKHRIGSEIGKWVKRFYVYHASLMAEIAVELKDQDKLVQMQREIMRYLPDYLETNASFPERIDRIKKLLSTSV